MIKTLSGHSNIVNALALLQDGNKIKNFNLVKIKIEKKILLFLRNLSKCIW